MKFRYPKWKKNKTWKRGYNGSKKWDSSCRNHGGCPYCESGRTHFDTVSRSGWEVDLREFMEDNGQKEGTPETKST